VKRGKVNHSFETFESILKLFAYRFSLGYLNKRHRYATNIGRTFEWEKPDFSRPSIPDPQTIAGTPCSVQGLPLGREAPKREKEHDLVSLETSGFLDQLGYDVQPATYSQIFRNPDSFKRALRESTRYR